MSLALALIPAAIVFALVIASTPVFMRFFLNRGVVGIDQQKKGRPLLPSSGGMPVAISFFFGMTALIALDKFVFKTGLDLELLLAAALSSLAIALIGFFDDLHIHAIKSARSSDAQEYRVGLPQWAKPLLTLVAAVPLMAVKAGTSTVFLPLVGSIDFGLLYALLLVPIGVVCVSNAANMLAGVNGVESGMMAVATLGVGYWAYTHGSVEGSAIAFMGAAGLLAFLFFNWVPAKILPGDSLTYFAGAVFITAAVIGNVEKFAFYAFLPWVAEAFLKLRGRFAKRSYGDLQPNGTLKAPYPKTYSMTHVAMKLGEKLNWGGKKGFTEKQVAVLLVGLEVAIVAAALVLVQA